MSGALVLTPSFQPAIGNATHDSTIAGRTMVNGKPDLATICSPMLFVYVYVLGQPQNRARS